jgi:hypothetical protein
MVSFTTLFTGLLLTTSTALATLAPKSAEQPVVTYLGTQGPILCKPTYTSLPMLISRASPSDSYQLLALSQPKA